ncbi:MAG: sensor histidine kinase, partial [Rubrobacteraceae bacterium]
YTTPGGVATLLAGNYKGLGSEGKVMQTADVKATERLGAFRVALATGLVFQLVIVMFFAVSSAGSGGADDAISVAYLASILLAGAGFAAAILKAGEAERVLWILLAGGLLARIAGTLIWEFGPSGFGPLAHHLLAYTLSYLMLFGAMLWLLVLMREETAPVAMLDAAGTMTAFGVLALYVVLSPVVSAVDFDGWRDLSWILSRPVCDLGFLFLALTAFRVRARPAFVDFLVIGFFLFVIADAMYLNLRLTGPYEFGNPPELLWAAGVMLLGFAALRRGVFGPEPRSRDMNALSFWLGLLLPPLLYACVLVWSAFHRPIPDYILFGGICVMLLIAVRMAFVARLNRRLGLENEKLAKQTERRLLSEELHDGLKQRLHGLLLSTQAINEYLEKDDPASARDATRDALDIARDAHRRVSRPIAELGILSRTEETDPAELLEEIFEDTRRHFHSLEVRDGFRHTLEELSPEEFGAAYRIISEALWNAAKHSKAKTARVEARKVGELLLINVRDDGRGFSPDEKAGMGVGLMRERARRVGARLEIYSSPNRGTTVQMRFER